MLAGGRQQGGDDALSWPGGSLKGGREREEEKGRGE